MNTDGSLVDRFGLGGAIGGIGGAVGSILSALPDGLFHDHSRTRDEMTHREWNNAVSKRLGELQAARRKAEDRRREELRAWGFRTLGVGLIDPRHGVRMRP